MHAIPGTDEPLYRAFISYSHADSAFAFWLHRRLERYSLPRGVRGHWRRGRMFIDRAEFAAGTDLSAQVQEALAQSAAMVVVCTPAAAESYWVNREIELFRSLHPDRPVLAALCEGEPPVCFPAAMRRHGDAEVEPLAADFRRGGDGRRLGLLKLHAGLAGVPLDRLIQRDNQRRQRRVTAITAAAVMLSVVMGSLALVAMRARQEAEVQRDQSEALVEFMLTDLRERLRGVGRLDVMDAVNAMAIRHYNAMHDLGSLPEGVLERRARVLSAMGEDAWAQGKIAPATAMFTESWRTTGELVERAPRDPQRLFTHAQNEYWLGQLAFGREKRSAAAHWQAYRLLAGRLTEAEPGAARGQHEIIYAETDLCALALSAPVDAPAARDHCAAATDVVRQLARREPDNLDTALQLANALAWQADAAAAARDTRSALALRREQSQLVQALAQRHPADMQVREARLRAALGLAEAAGASGDQAVAQTAAAEAVALGEALHQFDPSNKLWLKWLAQARQLQPVNAPLIH